MYKKKKVASLFVCCLLVLLFILAAGCGGGSSYTSPPPPSGGQSCDGGQPSITINTPSAIGASQVSGSVCGVDFSQYRVVLYALTNQWYVQPLIDAPFTTISSGGTWSSSINPWSIVVALLVNPAVYTPASTEITNPALDPNVVAWAMYPTGAATVSFANHMWGIKLTGSSPSDQFDPGPNFWSNDPRIVSVQADGLHLNTAFINGNWTCGEVYLLSSLGYGTYTTQISSHLDALNPSTVAAPFFIYIAPGQEFDNEYSGMNGLIPGPNNAQFVVQPYTVPGNLFRYVQPSNSQFTVQVEWRADHITFTSWNGFATSPAAGDIIQTWTYTGGNIPPVGQERVHINLWLLNGQAPVGGVGDEMVISSFTYQP